MTDPIIIERDDLTVTHHGKTRAGYDYVCLENPALVSAIVAYRKHRDMVREANWRRWN